MNSKLIGVFVVAAASLVASYLLMYEVGLGLIASQRKFNTARTASGHLESTLSALKDAETGQRGYLLTGEDTYLEPYHQAVTRIRAEQEPLRALSSTGELPASEVQHVIQFSEEKLTELEQTIQLRRTNGLPAVLPMVLAGSGKATMDKIRAAIAAMTAPKEQEAQQALADQTQRVRLRTASYFLLFVFNIGVLTWAYFRIARDASGQRRAQQAMARLAAIVEFSGDAILTKNLDGIVQTWNAGAERLFGYKAEEIIGKPITTLFPPDCLNEENEIHGRLLQGRPSERFESVRLAKDGRRIPVSVSVSPVKDEEGAIIGASSVVNDISDLVAARVGLQSEKDLLATTLASIGDAVIVTNAHGAVSFLNREAERLTGWSASEAAGCPLPDVFRIVNEHTRQPVENPVQKVLRQGTVVGLANHSLLLAKDGREVPIDDSAAPIRHPGAEISGVVLVFRDFTARKDAERALREAHDQLTSRAFKLSAQARLLDLTGDAISVRDLEDRITYWNKGAETTYGYTISEALGRVSHELLQTQFSEPLELIMEKVRRDHRWSGELVHTCRDGRRITVASRWALDFDEQDRPAGVLETSNDITERKQTEEKLREAQRKLLVHAANLEERVAERTAKLQDMVNELEHVSYAITHDMRAPLRAMSAFASLMLEGKSSTGPVDVADYSRRILAAATRLDKLIQDALHYTTMLRQELPLVPVDLSKLVHELLVTYPNLQPDQAEIHIEGSLPVVLGNESLLTQCFSNLLGNAVKFVEPGTRPHVSLRAEKHNGTARIWIQDNGIGIPKHAQGRLFKMFQRLTHDYEGSGIGLAIVRKVVRRMGGDVGAESEPHKGSRFWVELRVPPT